MRSSRKNPGSAPLVPHLRPIALWTMVGMPTDESRPRGLRETARIVRVPVEWLLAQAEEGVVPCLRADGVLLFNLEAVQSSLLALAAQPPRPADGAAATEDQQ